MPGYLATDYTEDTDKIIVSHEIHEPREIE